MRVLFWTELFRPDIGGVEIFSVPLIHALQARGVEFVVVTSHGRIPTPDVTDFERIPVHRFAFHPALLSRQPAAIRAIVEPLAHLKASFQPDLIHVNTAQPSLFFYQQMIARSPCPTLMTMHEPILTGDRNSLLGRTLQSASWITAVSAALLADLHQFMPEIADRSSAIRNGMTMPAIQPKPIDWMRPRLLCLGRLIREKGFDLALKALAQVLPDAPDVRLRITGDGTARAELETLARELHIADAVEFTGWVEPELIPDLMNEAAVVVMPSRWREPFGLAALQAAQLARPIIASRVGGLPEIVVDRQTGILVDNERSDQIADALRYLLGHHDRAEAMGAAARERARTHFAFEPMVDAYEQLYRRLTNRP